MSNIFCPDCGRANQYSGTKPNFCSFCAAALSIAAKAERENNQEPELPRRREVPPVRQSRSQTVSSHRRQPEPEYDEDVNVEDIASRAKVTLILTDKPQRPGEKVDLSQVFGNGSVAFRNTGTQDDLHGAESFSGGDKQAYLRKHFGKNMQTTRIEAKGE